MRRGPPAPPPRRSRRCSRCSPPPTGSQRFPEPGPSAAARGFPRGRRYPIRPDEGNSTQQLAGGLLPPEWEWGRRHAQNFCAKFSPGTSKSFSLSNSFFSSLKTQLSPSSMVHRIYFRFFKKWIWNPRKFSDLPFYPFYALFLPRNHRQRLMDAEFLLLAAGFFFKPADTINTTARQYRLSSLIKMVCAVPLTP